MTSPEAKIAPSNNAVMIVANGFPRAKYAEMIAVKPIAASLENLADQLDLDVRNWLNAERPAYRAEVTAASAAFMKRTQRLHRMLDAEPTLQELQRETDSLYEEWKVVYGYLSRCRTADRVNLSQIAAEIRIDLTDLNGSLRL